MEEPLDGCVMVGSLQLLMDLRVLEDGGVKMVAYLVPTLAHGLAARSQLTSSRLMTSFYAKFFYFLL